MFGASETEMNIFNKIKRLIRDLVLIIIFHAMIITILINQLENAFKNQHQDKVEFLPKGNRVETRVETCDQNANVDEC